MMALGATKAQASAVDAVLRHGNEKHGEGKGETVCCHIGRAVGHYDLRYREPTESESGQPHRSHVVARLILAIEKVLREAR